MKFELKVAGDKSPVSRQKPKAGLTFNFRPSAFKSRHAFTLIEMLVVIAILGILAGLAVPALKNLGKSNVTVSAARQLLDDVGRARQLAMANRTTVYMVFVPTNFWDTAYGSGPFNNTWFNTLSLPAKTDATNLCDKQLTGYTYISQGTVGDQPGRHTPHYLAPWQNLPDGVFIAQQKFADSPNEFYQIYGYTVWGFNVTNTIPFPTETNTAASANNSLPYLPYVAFNSFGQLTFDGVNVANRDEFIPLARGVVAPAIDPATKALVMTGAPSITEVPPGNSSDISYNLVRIDALTGRATLESYKIP